jgi:hypothetical protein
MNMKGYRFERLCEERLSDLKFLYKDAFLKDVTLEFLKKKYDTSFTGIQYVGYVAYDNHDRPAAYYGVLPLYVEHKDMTILAAQSGDTMTLSTHRGRGLFFNLAQEAYKLAANLGIKFVFGFPNMHNSYGGLMKLKWTHNGNMKIFRMFVPTLPLSVAARKSRTVGKMYNQRADRVLAKYSSRSDSFENPLTKSDYLVVKRDRSFFQYKKYSKKSILDIEGRCVYVKADKTLQVGDIERCSEEVFFRIIARLRKIAFELGAPALTLGFSPGVDYARFLEKKYRPRESLPICYLNLTSEVDLNGLRFSLADFDTF